MRTLASALLLMLLCVHPLVADAQDLAAIPVDYFLDISLSSPIPVEITTGQAVRVSGTVFDPTITMVGFSFFDESGANPYLNHSPVTDGRFKKTIFFPHKTSGTYDLVLYRYRGSAQSASQRDLFRSLNVMKGGGAASFPFDYFEEITLTSPMPVVFAPGQKLRVTGTVSDPSVSYIEFYLWWLSTGHRSPFRGSTKATFKAAVENGQFAIELDLTDQRPGDYWLDVYLHRRGSRSLGPRRFRPITVVPPPDFDDNNVVNFADFLTFVRMFGRSSAGGRFRFDLDGDGDIGFSDFLIFARAFGERL